MMQRVIVALLTVLIFGAGYAGGVWTERHRPLPPPPAAIMGEFTSAPSADKSTPPGEKKATPSAPKPYNRAQLVADIEKSRQQIDAYRNQLEAMDREFETGFRELLTPEQREAWDAKQARDQKKRADFKSEALASASPLSEEDIARLRQRPFEIAFWKVAISGTVEQITKDYKLDSAQQAATRQLLIARREKFLKLVDSTPPPTFKLTVLAASIKPLIDPSRPTSAPTPSSLTAPTK